MADRKLDYFLIQEWNGKGFRGLKVSYEASTISLNFLYKTIFIPINSWKHRIENWVVNKNVRETQRLVLINTMGAYKTSPLQAPCLISNNPPIPLKLAEINSLGDRAGGLTNDTKATIKSRTLENWQVEWNSATTGRQTHSLLPTVAERQQMQHLQDLDHGVVQLLTGHGPYKNYLLRFRRSGTGECEDCGEVDDAYHSPLFCPAHEDIRGEYIQRKALEKLLGT